MAGYLGTKAVLLSTTAATVTGDAEIAGDLTVDTNTLFVDSTNNNVGIGTNNPSGYAFDNLVVQSTAGSITIASTTTTNNGTLAFADGTVGGDAYRGYLQYNHSTDSLALGTAATERMRIDASGNSGFGTSSPDSKMTLQDDSDTTGPLITIKNQYRSGTTTADIIGGIAFSSWRDISNSISYVAGIYGRNYGYPGNNGYLSFCTGNNGGTDPYNAGSERVRITTDGSVQFANNLATGYGATFSTQSASRDVLNLNSDTTGSVGLIHFFNPNGFLAAITTSGSSVQYNTSSDYRLKEDVKPITGASDRVLALRPVNFAWKVDGSRTDGFIAHEAQEIIPEAVTGTKDDVRIKEYEVTPAVYDDEGTLVSEAVMGTREVPYYQSIDQSKLVPLLTAALQEALTEIAALKDRVAALEAN